MQNFLLIMPPSIYIRKASAHPSDIDNLVKLRRTMFEWMGYADENILNDSDTANRLYFEQNIPNGSFIGFLAFTDENLCVASGGFVLDHHPPSPNSLDGRIGYIMSISTLPDFRNQGIARKIMEHLIAYCREIKIKSVTLHPTAMGQKLYEDLGFLPANQMRIRFSY